jgi:hypothetical protein
MNDFPQPPPLTVGVDVICTDGFCGEAARVVLDATGRSITHVVVEPPRRGSGRLVPLGLLDATPDEIRLRCSLSEFDQLAPAASANGQPTTQESVVGSS